MDMPLSGQEYVLSNLAKNTNPIEIDGIIYMIPDAVNDLINASAYKEVKDKGDSK